MELKTEQEKFWRGEFGDLYIERNREEKLLSKNIALFADIARRIRPVSSVIEFGANIGLNLKAIKTLFPQISCAAVEINHKAAETLKKDTFFGRDGIEVIEESILEYEGTKTYDFVLIKGVLIHINPNELETVYQKLYDACKRYICIVEYYNPTPVTISYRGNENKLFKRDFAGEFMDKYPDCMLIDYGFCYHRDNNFPQDDATWFLLEKK